MTRESRLRTAHLAVGVAGLVAFIVSGRYMRAHFPAAYEGQEAIRFLYRANHLYVMFASLLNVAVGRYLVQSATAWRRRLQLAGSLAILVAVPMLIAAFVREPHLGSPVRPITLAGCIVTLAGGLALAVAGPPSGAWSPRVLLFAAGALASGSVASAQALTPLPAPAGPALELPFDSIHIGVAEYAEGPTGVTVVYFPKRAWAAVDVRGGSPGTSGIDGLRLGYDSPSIDAIVLTGGSAYGLEAVEGVRTELMASGRRDTSRFNVALVAGAVIYDFPYRSNSVHPDKALGRAALRNAQPGRFPLGARGAGRSASVGKYFGYSFGEPAGQGAAFRQIGPTRIAVFTVVNAVGNILDRQGRVVRGNRDPETGVRADILEDLRSGAGARKRERDKKRAKVGASSVPEGNTTLTVVVTDQKLQPWELQRLAVQVHTSMARALSPFQTWRDGDVLFAVSTAETANAELDVTDIATYASELAWDAVLASVP